MKAARIYHRSATGLTPMFETDYVLEADLQALLADYPDLLAGDQIQPDDPRRLLLITREAGVPGEEGGLGRWSLDHMFVDQDGMPTLVEVKRSSDTRLRREVVGQMLDYAANIAAYWAPGQAQLLFEARCQAEDRDPDTELRAFLAVGAEDPNAIETFWQGVTENLASRTMRLLFVADVIPLELQRIIEFLNESMLRVQVLAVEIKQFVGGDQQALVPRVIGRTAASVDVKRASRPAGKPRQWDEASLLAEIEANGGKAAVQVARDLIGWTRANGLGESFGRGAVEGTYYPVWVDAASNPCRFLSLTTAPRVTVQFDNLIRFAPFDQSELRMDLAGRLNAIPGVLVPPDTAERGSWPTIPLAVLAEEDALSRFMQVFDWALDRLRGS